MKRRTLTLTLCILAVVALIGVGFASWVITNDTQVDTDPGKITIDKIDDQTHEITIITKMDDKKVVFGATTKSKTDDRVTKNWLRYKDTKANETLEIAIEFTVTNYESLATEGGITATIKEKDGSTAYAAAVAAGYVVPFTSEDDYHVEVTVSAITADTDDKTLGKGTITIKFKWGSYFDYVNPINYYNRFESDAERTVGVTYLQDAKNSLDGAVFSNLVNAEYVLTVTPVTKTEL